MMNLTNILSFGSSCNFTTLKSNYLHKNVTRISIISKNPSLVFVLALASLAAALFFSYKKCFRAKEKEVSIKNQNSQFNCEDDNLTHIFLNCTLKELNSLSRVNKTWCEKANLLEVRRNAIYQDFAFNPEDWNTYYFEEELVSEEEIRRGRESLPPNIYEILNSPSTIFPDKKMGQTHHLFYIPEKVKGEALTINIFKKMTMLDDNAICPTITQTIGDVPIDSGWFLMTKTGLDSKTKKKQEEELLQINENSSLKYNCPGILELLISYETFWLKFQKCIKESSMEYAITKESFLHQPIGRPFSFGFNIHSKDEDLWRWATGGKLTRTILGQPFFFNDRFTCLSPLAKLN